MKHSEETKQAIMDYNHKVRTYCAEQNCYNCKCNVLVRKHNLATCFILQKQYPEEFYEYMMEQLYPKTHKEVFLEMFPNAPLSISNYPKEVLPCHLGWEVRTKKAGVYLCAKSETCANCWDKPHKVNK